MKIFTLFVLMLPGWAFSADWPGWMGVSGNGVSDEKLPAMEKLDELWRGQVGIGNASVAVAQNKAITAGHDGDKTEKVVCFDATTGAVIWEKSYPGKLMPNLHTGGPNATPLITGDRVFTVSKDGRVLCLSLADGSVIWERQLTKALETKAPTWGFGSSPVLHGEKLIFLAGRTIALDPKDGSTVWRSPTQYKHGYSTVTCTGDGEKSDLVVAMDGAGVSFLKAESGEELIRKPLIAKFNTVATTPLILDSSESEFFIATNMASMRLHWTGSTLDKKWETKELQNNFTNSLFHQGHIYGIDGKQKQSRSRFVCMDAKDGKIVWEKPEFGHGATVLAGEIFWVIRENGELVALAADPESYRELGRKKIFSDGGYCWTPPTVANGRIYLRSQAGEICCLGSQ